MEFEMIVPGVIDADSPSSYEPDYDQDEPAVSIDDICEFFDSDNNSSYTIGRLRRTLNEQYNDWKSTKVGELWAEEGLDYYTKWVKENVSDNEVAEYLEKEKDLFGETVPTKKDWEQFIEDTFNEYGSKYYNKAMEDYSEEKVDEDDFDEEEFLESIGINRMSDVEDHVNVGLDWPHYTSIEPDGESIESVGDEFSDAIGKTVYASDNYHGARRSSNAYSLEPDGSINTDEGEAGLEFISPPMSIEEMLEDLHKVKKWADKRGAYTDKSTGLHINVSIPEYSRDKLDYIKLAVLLGDQYVLEQFGRLTNGYAESAIRLIKDRAKDNPTVDKLLTQLQYNVESIASKLLHSGITDKYTSINTKNDYVEFRSAGGDWLDKNFDKIENTLLRFVVALDAALDPKKYKKEYQKQLYKVLKPKDPKSDMSMFARFMSGELTRNQYANLIEKQRKERFITQGIRIIHPSEVDENDWEITFNDGKKDESIYIANTEKVSNEQEAYDAAKKFKPNWFKPENVEYVTVKPYKFSEELDDMKFYDLEYGPKYISVVAKNDDEARELARVIDPDYFSAYPNARVAIRRMDDSLSKRTLAGYFDRQKAKIKQGEEWLARPKIWRATGRSNYGGRYYIAAITREEAVNIAKQLDPDMVESDIFDIYVSDAYVSKDEYEAYQNAQEDLINRRNEEQERLRQEQSVDITDLKMYRASTLNGYSYIVARNGAEAAEIATQVDPEKFPNIENVTVQDQSNIESMNTPSLLRHMYASQQQTINSRRDLSRGQVNSEEYSVYEAFNGRGGSMFIAARTPVEAHTIAARLYPDVFNDEIRTQRYGDATQMDAVRLLQSQSRREQELNQEARMAPGEQMYIVRNNDTGHEVRLAAGSEQNARGRAIRNDPHNFTGGSDITVTLLRRTPPATPELRGQLGQAQPAFTEPGTTRSYRVINRDTGDSRYFPGSDEQDAIMRAREQYPSMFPQGMNIYAQVHRPGGDR